MLNIRGDIVLAADKILFYSIEDWYRDSYLCGLCGSNPRRRAVMWTLKKRYPDYLSLKIYESSPSGATFEQLSKEENYTWSYYYEDMPLGVRLEGGQNEKLENLTFEDATFDIFFTQDVMEHVNNPQKAFKEIGRVLKPGGIHLFTTPLTQKINKSRPRISLKEDGNIEYVLSPIYHGNPISVEGSLVTWDWGFDIVDFIENCTGMKTEIISFEKTEKNINMGLEAEYLEVMISQK